MFDILPAPVRNFVDSIFSPPLSFLQLMQTMLDQAGTVIGKGIDLNKFFSFFSYLPPEWQGVVTSALVSVTLLAILLLVKAAWDTYLRVKGSVKWW